MSPAELAARNYIKAWAEPDRDARAALLEASFAVDGRIVARGQTLQGRAAVAAAIDDLFADPRKLTTRSTSPIEAAGAVFRFRAAVEYPDGKPFLELMDVGEVGSDGRITQLFTFLEPLRDGTPA